MDRKYSARLEIKSARVFKDTFRTHSDLSIYLFRTHYDKEEKGKYDFHELIENYSDLDERTINRLQDAILTLFTMEEIKSLEFNLDDMSGGKNVKIYHREIKFPIPSDFASHDKLPWADSSGQNSGGLYVFSRFGVTGYYDLDKCNILKTIRYNPAQQQMQSINTIIFDAEMRKLQELEYDYNMSLYYVRSDEDKIYTENKAFYDRFVHQDAWDTEWENF